MTSYGESAPTDRGMDSARDEDTVVNPISATHTNTKNRVDEMPGHEIVILLITTRHCERSEAISGRANSRHSPTPKFSNRIGPIARARVAA